MATHEFGGEMNKMSMIRRLDAVYMYIRTLEPFVDPGVVSDVITVLVSVREDLSKGTPLENTLSNKEDVIDELARIGYSLSPREAAEEILKDLREGGEL